MLQYMHVFKVNCVLLGKRILFSEKYINLTYLILFLLYVLVSQHERAFQVSFLSQHNCSALQLVL